MKSMLIIGMGRFGRHLTIKFNELGDEVMIVDKDEEVMSDMVPLATSAQIGDATKGEVLRSLGVANFDICFVCIGNDFQASLEITSRLREMGAKYIVSKANREIHEKFLLRNGADEVVYPERDIAEKSAIRFSANHVFDYIELTSEYSIIEIPPMKQWVGKTIKDASIRSKYHLSILATKKDDDIAPLPKPDYVIRDDEHLIVAAGKKDLNKVLGKL